MEFLVQSVYIVKVAKVDFVYFFSIFIFIFIFIYFLFWNLGLEFNVMS